VLIARRIGLMWVGSGSTRLSMDLWRAQTACLPRRMSFAPCWCGCGCSVSSGDVVLQPKAGGGGVGTDGEGWMGRLAGST
jgi:hypothetical protein